MAVIEDMFKGGNIVTGLAIGVGVAVVAPLLVPVLRPLAKSLVRSGLMAYDQGRAVLADLSERTEELVSEVRDETVPAHQTKPAASRRAKRSE
jgi:polyhydroxyalkanoate synthesis regulator phasin